MSQKSADFNIQVIYIHMRLPVNGLLRTRFNIKKFYVVPT
jgi:hypothetical protein